MVRTETEIRVHTGTVLVCCERITCARTKTNRRGFLFGSKPIPDR